MSASVWNSEWLGRLYARDERDERYALRQLIRTDEPVKTYRYYPTGPVLDQGPTPQCVGFAWRQWLSSSLTMTPVNVGPTSRDIYGLAQLLDEWPGQDYDGTSVRGGVKALQEMDNRVTQYVWSHSADECARWLLNDQGTIVFGTTWYRDMTELQPGQIARPSGNMQGGHAYLCVGYSTARGAFRCVNSWGRRWGLNGRFWILGEDMQALLNDYGEACAAIEKSTSQRIAEGMRTHSRSLDKATDV